MTMSRLFRVILLAVLAGRLALAPAQGASTSDTGQGQPLPLEEIPTDQIIVKYKEPAEPRAEAPAAPGQIRRLSQATGAELAYVREMSGGAHVYRIAQAAAQTGAAALAATLAALPEVEYAEPDQIMTPALVPNDPNYSSQWHFRTPSAGNYGINMPPAWDITTGSNSVVAAVIDTGILSHADLAGRALPGYDFITNVTMANDGDGRDSDPSDPGDWTTANECAPGWPGYDSSWHGTHVAGTIAANSNNGRGVAGVNWAARILPVRVLGRCGGYVSDIVDGIRWAAGLPVPSTPANPNPASVLNLSLSGLGNPGCSNSYQYAIDAVLAAGKTIVAAAGNNNADAAQYQPGNCAGVITAAAVNRNGSRAYYSNYGAAVEISAPGGEFTGGYSSGILSTSNTGTQGPASDTYLYYQGTSQAAPLVTGVITLLYSVNPALTPAQVLQALQTTATAFPAGSTCTTSICGSGIVNAAAALSAVAVDKPHDNYLPAVFR